MKKRALVPWLPVVLGVIALLSLPVVAREAPTVLGPTTTRPPVVANPPRVVNTVGPFTVVPGKVVLEGCTPAEGSTPESMKGTGTLKLMLRCAGKDYMYSLANASFSNLTADNGGQMTGGIITLAPGQVNDLLGSGFSLDIASGTVIKRYTRGGGALAELSMRARLAIPFNDLAGNPFRLDYDGLKLSIDSLGAVSLAGANGKNGRFTLMMTASPASNSAFQAGGLTISPQDTNIDWKASDAAPASYTLTCPSGLVSTSIPKLLLVDGNDLVLAFNNLTVADTGEVTVADMDVPGGRREDITLANPANFAVSVTRARVSMDHNKFTAFTLYANIVLPPCVTNDDGGRVSMPAVWFDMMKEPVIDLKMGITTPLRPIGNVRNAGPVTAIPLTGVSPTRYLNFNGYRVAMSDMVIDLSREEPVEFSSMPKITGKRWQGVYARKASITLPTAVWGASGGKPVILQTTDCYVDANGFTGEVEAPANGLSAIEIHGFNPKLKNLHIVFGRNSILASDCRGTAEVPQFSGILDLVVKISNTDTTLIVDQPSTLENKKLGTIISVFNGSLREGSEGKYALWLNGAISLDIPECPALKKSALGFHGLGIDTTGQFVTTDPQGWLNLDAPAQADFGLLHCNVSSLLFAQNKDTKKWSVSMNGEYSLNSDLPVSGTLSCTPLRVDEGATDAAKPSIAAKEVLIGVDADVFSTARLTGSLKILQDAKTGTWDALRGDINLALLVAGESPPMNNSDGGGHFELFLKQGNIWAAAGSFNMPAGYNIPLGNSGLALYKFMGGIARNMTPKKADFGGVDDLQPAPDANNWLFSAGCGIELVKDPGLFHAEGNMTIGLPDFFFNIHGDGWLLVGREAPKPGHVVADVTLNPSVPSFAIDASVNLKLPSADLNVIQLSGTLGLLVSPDDVHLDIGWPYPEKAVQGEVLGGVLNVRAGSHMTPLSYQFSAGTGFDYWIFSGSIEGSLGYQIGKQPYLFGHVRASGEVDFYVVSLGCSANLAAELYADYMSLDGTFKASVNMPWPVPDLHVKAPFGVTIP
ncbi:MAG: hypothetical protein ACYC7E_10485 [Armatimonadota bacterium]